MKRLALLLLLLAGPALAANGITGISVRVNRGLTSIAVSAIVKGDDDSSAVLQLFGRLRGACKPYDSLMVMGRRTHGAVAGANGQPASVAESGETFEGRILDLQPGQAVDWYIWGTDAGGGGGLLYGSTDTTMRVPGIPSGGPVYYVNAATGSSANNGLSPLTPKQTISQARALLLGLSDGGVNGGIIIAPGIYHESQTWSSSRVGPRFIMGSGDSVIVCGCNPMVEAGYALDWTTPIAWTKTAFPIFPPGHAVNDSIYATYFPDTEGASSPGDSCQNVVIGWSEQLHRKTSLLAMQADSTGERSGWYWQNDTLYVKRRNGQSPAGQVIHAGYRDRLFDMRSGYWHISRLTFRFAGGLKQDNTYAAAPNPGMNGSAIYISTSASPAPGITVDSCTFYGMNAPSIRAAVNVTRNDSLTVANCLIDGLTVGSFGYPAGKSRSEEQATQLGLVIGYANIYRNTITGCFNGIQNGNVAATDTLTGAFSEYAYNTVTNCADDGFELDATHAINSLSYGNTISNCGRGFSYTSCLTGPIFAFYNLIVRSHTAGLKGASGTTAIARIQQNTVSSSYLNSVSIDWGSASTNTNTTIENCILGGSGTRWSYIVGDVNAVYPNTVNTLNWNCLDSTEASIAQLGQQANGTSRDLAGFRSVVGWEKNGFQGTGQAFTDSSRFDFSLPANSPAHGRARRIAGVNTGLNGEKWGTTPDHGALPRMIRSDN